MEIQPPSSVAEATARFTGWTQAQIQNAIQRIAPNPGPNTLKHSTDTVMAISASGGYAEHLEAERIEGHRILQPVLTNPWTSIHDIEQGKMDTFYLASTQPEMEDLLSFTIGKVTGAPDAQDPRLSFVQNLLKLKQHQRGMDNEHSLHYMQHLFTTQIQNGKSYYQVQAERQNQEHADHVFQKLASTVPVHQYQIQKHSSAITPGVAKVMEPGKKRSFSVHNHGPFQYHEKKAKLDRLQAKHSQGLPHTGLDITEHHHPLPSNLPRYDQAAIDQSRLENRRPVGERNVIATLPKQSLTEQDTQTDFSPNSFTEVAEDFHRTARETRETGIQASQKPVLVDEEFLDFQYDSVLDNEGESQYRPNDELIKRYDQHRKTLIEKLDQSNEARVRKAKPDTLEPRDFPRDFTPRKRPAAGPPGSAQTTPGEQIPLSELFQETQQSAFASPTPSTEPLYSPNPVIPVKTPANLRQAIEIANTQKEKEIKNRIRTRSQTQAQRDANVTGGPSAAPEGPTKKSYLKKGSGGKNTKYFLQKNSLIDNVIGKTSSIKSK